jgi:hypothetical protein
MKQKYVGVVSQNLGRIQYNWGASRPGLTVKTSQTSLAMKITYPRRSLKEVVPAAY